MLAGEPLAGTIVVMQRRRLAELNIASVYRVVRPGLATAFLLAAILLTILNATLADDVSSVAREHAHSGKSTSHAASSTASSAASSGGDTLRVRPRTFSGAYPVGG